MASWPRRTKAGRQWRAEKRALERGKERVSRENVSWPRSRVTTLRTVGSAPFVVVEEGPPRVSLSFITRIVVVHEYIRIIVFTDGQRRQTRRNGNNQVVCVPEAVRARARARPSLLASLRTRSLFQENRTRGVLACAC